MKYICLNFIFCGLLPLYSAITINQEQLRALCHDVRTVEASNFNYTKAEEIVDHVAKTLESKKILRSAEQLNPFDQMLFRKLASEFIENRGKFSLFDAIFRPQTILLDFKIKHKKDSNTDIINSVAFDAANITSTRNQQRIQSNLKIKKSSINLNYAKVTTDDDTKKDDFSDYNHLETKDYHQDNINEDEEEDDDDDDDVGEDDNGEDDNEEDDNNEDGHNEDDNYEDDNNEDNNNEDGNNEDDGQNVITVRKSRSNKSMNDAELHLKACQTLEIDGILDFDDPDNFWQSVESIHRQLHE